MTEGRDIRCICGERSFERVFTYTEPPAGEIRFDFGKSPYRREIRRCTHCGHFLSVHDLDMSGLYSGEYVNSTYASGLKAAFDRINALEPSRSDNTGRVDCVAGFVSRHFGARMASGFLPAVLDIGSGLCVFLYRLHRTTGWPCTALDPDPRAVEHAQKEAGVQAVCADFMQADTLGRFDVITLNKVIEHVLDPVAMLARCHRYLSSGGVVYVEVPDGEAAMTKGYGREEFFIDHHHVFSARSLRILAEKAGFRIETLESLREPSSKFTLRCFLTPSDSAA